MTTFTLRNGTHHAATRRPINPVHMLVRGLYVLVGIAALALLYARLQLVLADPIFSAIVTLMLVMAFTVVAAPRVQRP